MTYFRRIRNAIQRFTPRYIRDLEYSTGRLEQANAYINQQLQTTQSDYLNLLISILCGEIYKDPSSINGKITDYDAKLREYGCDWPLRAHSMIGRKRLENLRLLTESVLGNDIPGDLIETGVWRGGASILLCGILHTYRVTNRKVIVADSFQGLPAPDPEKYPVDVGSIYHEYPELAVSLTEVQENFTAYGLLDDQVVFLEGWFKDTLPSLSSDRLALMRLDGDMYESTMDALTHLYYKLSPGGYVIIDDYHIVPQCREAVHNFWQSNQIAPTVQQIDGVGIYWQK